MRSARVVALSDSSGSVVARYHLDAWGRYRVPTELSASANRFGFTGYLFDQETNLYYAKARFYDPEFGRFTSQDSVLGQMDTPPSLHRFVYAGNRPTFYIDANGHAWITVNDLNNAGKAFGGAVYGVGEVIAAPGVLTYQATGAFLYNVTGEWQYKAQAEKLLTHLRGVRQGVRVSASPRHDRRSGIHVTVDSSASSIEKGDAFEAAAGFGNAAGQVLTVVEGVKGAPQITVAPARVLATNTGTVVRGGAAVAITGGRESLGAAGIVLSSNVRGNEATTVQENTPRKGDISPTEQVSAVDAFKPLTPSSTARLKDPKTGRFVSDPNNPPSPYEFTDAQRRAAWKRLAGDPTSPLTEMQRQQIRERGWRGPQQVNRGQARLRRWSCLMSRLH